MLHHHCFATFLAFATATATTTAQDMIAVGWTGQIYGLDSFTGAINPIGPGLQGQNAGARDDHGRIWSTAAGSTLSVLDPTQPNASVPLPGLVSDLRGLANGGAQYLWGIENGPIDMLVHIDKVTGAKTIVGPTTYTGIEGLEQLNFQLYAWDTNAGLLRIDRFTGVTTDINPSIGTSGAQIAWLTTRADGKLIGGQNSLYEIDITTGAVTLIANLGNVDLRGADSWQAFTRPYGTGCAGANGPVSLAATLTGSGTLQLTLQSNNHAPNVVGATLFGLSNQSSSYGPLPVSMDPQLGTVGCTLYTSVHASFLGITSSTGPATLTSQYSFNLLNNVFAFYVQHVTLEPVTGGVALSNGVIVQIGR